MVSSGSDDRHAVVRAATAFPTGALLRFQLAGPDGALVSSWAYEIDRAPHVVSVLPGAGVSEVPVTTGIELAFDQDGIAVSADDLTIAPAVGGHVETFGRHVAFVPDALRPGTVYTVTLRAGVRRPGSTFALERPVSWQFETQPTVSDPRADAWLSTSRTDAAPDENPVLFVERETPDEGTPVTSGSVSVHRLPDRAAAISTAIELGRTRQEFTSGRHHVVPTTRLPLVLAEPARFIALGSSLDASGIRVPRRLAAGWYLVTLRAAGRPSQTVLQVGSLAPYTLVTTSRTLVWTNDIETAKPLAGVRVSVAGGAPLGRTATNGILDVPTPDSLRNPPDRLIEQPDRGADDRGSRPVPAPRRPRRPPGVRLPRRAVLRHRERLWRHVGHGSKPGLVGGPHDRPSALSLDGHPRRLGARPEPVRRPFPVGSRAAPGVRELVAGNRRRGAPPG